LKLEEKARILRQSQGAKSDKELKLEEKAKILRQNKSAQKLVPSVEEMIKQAGDYFKKKEAKGMAMGGVMKSKGYAKGGAMKTKGASKGGKMRVRPPSGKKSGLYGR
jgi:hypothetical protein